MNQHEAPTPRSKTPSGITSFFGRKRSAPEPLPEEPEPDSEEATIIADDDNAPESEDTTDEVDDDDYLTATQNSEGDESIANEEATQATKDDVGEEGDEEEAENEVEEDEPAGAEREDNNDANGEGDINEEDETIQTFPPEEGADLANYRQTAADIRLDGLYGDHPHENDGCHLDGGIANDLRWQSYWKRVVSVKPIWYRNPQGRIGKLFIRKLTEIIRGVRERKWNSERIIVFPAVILYKAANITAAKDIRARIETRMRLWDEERYSALLEDMEMEVRLRGVAPRDRSDDEKDRDYNARVLSGHLRSACRTLTDRGGGSVMAPTDTCTKSGRPVLEVLRSKHPPMREPQAIGVRGGAFEEYEDGVPTTIPIRISSDTIEEVAVKLSGAAGPGGTDSETLKAWLLGFGQASGVLRGELAALTTWIANENPSWAAYRALMACRLVALDKQPGTRPVGIGEMCRRLMAKSVLATVGGRATSATGNYNLCVGLKAGIEGGVHVIREAMKEAELAVERATYVNEDPSEEDSEESDDGESDGDSSTASRNRVVRWRDEENGDNNSSGDEDLQPYPGMQTYDLMNPHGTLCIDARNGFNELNRKAMLWTVRHLWASGARFAFNCYRHAAQLVVRQTDSECTILHSREGVTQGDPLSMVLYGLAMVPLSKFLRKEVPSVIQPWYADDCAMAGGGDRDSRGDETATGLRTIQGILSRAHKIDLHL